MAEELRALLRDEARDPALQKIEPLALELSPDGATARLAYAIAETGEETALRRRAEAALARASGFLRSRIAEQLGLKRTPKLVFRFVGLRGEHEEGGES